jgi:thiol-disulfide isomerase/thioredoxin
MGKKFRRNLLYLPLALALGVGLVQSIRDSRLSQPLQAGALAPALSGQLVDGGRFELGELKGQVLLVSFWATWCPACREEMPVLRRLEAEYRDRGVALVAANLDDSESRGAAVQSYLRGLDGPRPLVLWPEPGLVGEWKARVLPTLYVIGRDGRIVAGFSGAPSERKLKRAVDLALVPPKAG